MDELIQRFAKMSIDEVSSKDLGCLVDEMSGGDNDPFVQDVNEIDGLTDRLASIRIEDDGIVLQSERGRCLIFHIAWSPGNCSAEANLLTRGPPFIEGF